MYSPSFAQPSYGSVAVPHVTARCPEFHLGMKNRQESEGSLLIPSRVTLAHRDQPFLPAAQQTQA